MRKKIKTIFGYTGPILDGHSIVAGKKHRQKLLKISSLPLKKRLGDFGIVPNKTTKETYPEAISRCGEEINRQFIKGVFEGDGSVFMRGKTGAGVFSLVGTKELLEAVQSQFIQRLGVSKTKISKNTRKKKNHYYLRYDGNYQCLRILRWLYADSKLHLNRKYQKYLELENTNERRCVGRRYGNETIAPDSCNK